VVTLLIEQRRGFAVEAVHAIDAIACHVDGSLRTLSGVDAVTTFRSASKPFQLAASLASIGEELRAQLTSRDLALGSASHHGEPAHIAALEQLLGKLGCVPGELLCGAHAPVHGESAAVLLRTLQQPTTMHNNCAGKHAFMVAATRAQGYEPDYRPAAHPLQRAVAQVVADACGGFVGTVVDGCGLPSFVLSLSAMARGYAALARSLAQPPQAREPSFLPAIVAALREHPLLMSGSEAFDGWLMRHSGVLAKVGAGGLLCLALPEQQIGIALKVRSGSELVRPAATMALLAHAFPGLVSAELPARNRLIYNVVGSEVGAIVTRFAAD
jgi:L-asparaginase II